MTAPLRLALFDCDGTLVDSQHMIVAAMREAWRAYDLPELDPEAVRRVIGLSLEEVIARLLPGSTAAQRQSIGARYRSVFFERRQSANLQEPLFPGAIEALEALEAEGFLLGVATGKSRRGLEAVLQRPGLQGRFATTQTVDDGPGKPNPHMVLRAIAETGADPAQVAVIGDTVFDIEMARAAGVASLGVSWGYHTPDDLSAAGAGSIAGTFADVPEAVMALLSG